jgi:hypothetical protein
MMKAPVKGLSFFLIIGPAAMAALRLALQKGIHPFNERSSIMGPINIFRLWNVVKFVVHYLFYLKLKKKKLYFPIEQIGNNKFE